MGAALAIHHARAGNPTALLGTAFDTAIVDALRAGRPHPALGVSLPGDVECRDDQTWDDVLSKAQVVLVAVSSSGLGDVVSNIAGRVRSDAIWAVATKGWDEVSLRPPSAIIADAVGSSAPLAILGGPALAPELVAGAPTTFVCAARDPEVAAHMRARMEFGDVSVTTTDDVIGVETAAAYKNVVAIAVGACEGLSEALTERVFVHQFANARAAVFACGLRDMSALACALGGRADTILGLAGAGDLYVTCLGGRNGTLGRLLGAGQTPEQAQATIGSTVEGAFNTRAALAVAERVGVDLPTARAVDAMLSGRARPDAVIRDLMGALTGRSNG